MRAVACARRRALRGGLEQPAFVVSCLALLAMCAGADAASGGPACRADLAVCGVPGVAVECMRAQAGDAGVLRSALTLLGVLAGAGDEAPAAREPGAVGAALDALAAHVGALEVVLPCLTFLAAAARGEAPHWLADVAVLRSLTAVLSAHGAVVDVALLGVGLLALLASSREHRERLLHSGALRGVLGVAGAHAGSLPVLLCCMRFLAGVVDDSACAQEALDAGVVEAVGAAMGLAAGVMGSPGAAFSGASPRRASDASATRGAGECATAAAAATAEVATWGCAILSGCSLRLGAARGGCVKAGAVEWVVAAMASQPAALTLTRFGLGFLRNVSEPGPLRADVTAGGAVRLVLGALRAHPAVEVVQVRVKACDLL